MKGHVDTASICTSSCKRKGAAEEPNCCGQDIHGIHDVTSATQLNLQLCKEEKGKLNAKWRTQLFMSVVYLKVHCHDSVTQPACFVSGTALNFQTAIKRWQYSNGDQQLGQRCLSGKRFLSLLLLSQHGSSAQQQSRERCTEVLQLPICSEN